MARAIKLKESDITKIVKRIIREDSHYGMNKGDKSRTRPGKRDYEEKGEEMTHESIKEAFGGCRTLKDCVKVYTEMYNASDNVPGVPTPQEFRTKAEEIDEETGGGDDGPQMMLWWFAGIAVALTIRWINTHEPPWSWNSDITLKENIELVGKSESGVNIYEFDYINKKYGNGRYRGVMAQEVPSASFVGPEGTLMVDYSKLDVQFEELN